MRIESLKLKSARNPNIFECVADGENFLLHSDIIVKFGIATNSEVDKEKLNEAKSESDYLICLNKATDYISNKLKTTKQVRDYLYKKEFKGKTINEVIEKLREYNILNDNFYASYYINANREKLSKREIQNKLLSRGIKKEDYEELIENFDDSEQCDREAKKFMKNRENTRENVEKLIRHLQYKGFGWDNISSALRRFRDADEMAEN